MWVSSGATTSTLVIDASSATGVKSSIGRYGGFTCNNGEMIVEVDAMPMV